MLSKSKQLERIIEKSSKIFKQQSESRTLKDAPMVGRLPTRRVKLSDRLSKVYSKCLDITIKLLIH